MATNYDGTYDSKGGPMHIGGVYSVRDINYITNTPKKDPQEEESLEKFGHINFWMRYMDILDKRQAGTGKWFIDHPTFRDWLEGTNRVLWSPGIPGAGKTVLSSIVLEYLLQARKLSRNPNEIGVSCIYCNHKEQETPVTYLSSIISQLLHQLPAVPKSVKSIIQDHGERHTRPGREQCADILRLLEPEFSKLFLVIDGLDECPSAVVTQFIKPILGLSSIRILVFSRNVSFIEHYFRSSPTLEVKADANDIKTYTDACIQDSPDLSDFVKTDKTLHDNIISTITRQCQGMFLLAHLHVQGLTTLDNRAAIYNSLKSLPAKLDDSINEAMQRIEGQSEQDRLRAKQVLLWVSGAARPLTIKELQHALAVEIGSTNFDAEACPASTRLVSVCAGLVAVDSESQKVRLAHETIQAYFKKKRHVLFPDSEKIIGSACLTYLNFDNPRRSFCESDKKLEKLLKENTLLDYAARYWGQHCHGEIEIELKDVILDFFLKRSNVECAVQIMFLPEFRFLGYSQHIPRRVTAIHLLAHFDLTETLRHLLDNSSHLNSKDSDGQTPLSLAASQGHFATVEILLSRADINPNSCDSQGRSPLLRAAEEGQAKVVEIFLRSDKVQKDLPQENGQTPLSRAAEEGHERVVKLLLECEDVDVDSRDESYTTPLGWAVTREQVKVVELLLSKQADANSYAEDDRTNLASAIDKGNVSIVRLLLDSGAETDHQSVRESIGTACEQGDWKMIETLVERESKALENDKLRRTILGRAIANGQEHIANQLSKHDDKVEMVPIQGQTAWKAAMLGNTDLLQQLLDVGVDINATDDTGRTALRWAVENGHPEMLRLLVQNGANIDAADARGISPLRWAIQSRREEMFRPLIENGANINAMNDTGTSVLRWAVNNSLDDTVIQLLNLGTRVDSEELVRRTALFPENHYDLTPLHFALRHGREAVARVLIEKGADLDVKDSDGNPALHSAITRNLGSTMRLLIEKGVDINAKNSEGRTGLHQAITFEHESLALQLIYHGIRMDEQDRSLNTAMHLATKNRLFGVVQALLNKGADFELENGEIRTPLEVAAVQQDLDLVKLFLNQGMKIRPHEYMGVRLLLHAVRIQDFYFVKQLLVEQKIKADGRFYNNDGFQTPLHLAAELGQIQILDLFLQQPSIDPNILSSFDAGTPLHAAVRKGHADVVIRLLQDRRVDREIVSLDGYTPLHLAATSGLKDIVQILLQYGVDLSARTRNGHTAMELAWNQRHHEVSDLLFAASESSTRPQRYVSRDRWFKWWIEREY